MPTPKQLAANRANSLRSTGPKTDTGKATASRNSLTHGLLARDLLVHTGGGREDAAEFHSLLDDLGEALAPQGMLETILVEKIAVAYWRLRRAARAEAGAIHSALDDLASRMHADDEDRVIEDMSVLTCGFGYHIVRYELALIGFSHALAHSGPLLVRHPVDAGSPRFDFARVFGKFFLILAGPGFSVGQ